MAQKDYSVDVYVDNKKVGSTSVKASNSLEARKMAEYKTGGQAGYAGKKIRTCNVREVR